VGNAWVLDYWHRRTGVQATEQDMEPLTWSLAQMGRACGGPQYLSAVEALQSVSRKIAAWWDGGFDLLLTPTLAEPPVPLGQFEAEPDNALAGLFRAAAYVPFTPVFNVTGQPAISLPLHMSKSGLPIGNQLVAAYGREDLLIRVASQLEVAAGWASRVPPVRA
jgi:amidase